MSVKNVLYSYVEQNGHTIAIRVDQNNFGKEKYGEPGLGGPQYECEYSICWAFFHKDDVFSINKAREILDIRINEENGRTDLYFDERQTTVELIKWALAIDNMECSRYYPEWASKIGYRISPNH